MSFTDEQKFEAMNGYKKPLGRPVGSKDKSPRRKKMELVLDAGDNTNMMNHSLEIFQMPKIDTNDPEMVWDRTVEYFQICAKNDMKPSVPGYALALGIQRQTLLKWITGGIKRDPEVMEIVHKVYSLLNAQIEDYMLSNKVNPVSGIFVSKNNFGYTDKTEVEVKNDVMSAPSTEALLEEAKLLDADVESPNIIDTTYKES